MAKVEIIDCSYDVIKEIPNVMTLFNNLFGDGTIALYSVMVDDKLNFVGRSGNNCALVSDEGYTLFELKDENLFSITRDDYLVYVDDCCFVEDSGIQHSLDFFKVQEDVEGYDGCISYKQYNPSNDTLITITYQQMYNDREQGDKIYSCHTVDIDRVYIDERFQELGRVDYGFVPKRAKYFHKLEVDSDMVGYKLAALKEYGFFKYLMNGADGLFDERRIIRYIGVQFINSKGDFLEFWPLGQQVDTETIRKLINSYGLNDDIPNLFIDIYNGWDETTNVVKEIVQKMKVITDECLHDSSTEKCAKLTLRND